MENESYKKKDEFRQVTFAVKHATKTKPLDVDRISGKPKKNNSPNKEI